MERTYRVSHEGGTFRVTGSSKQQAIKRATLLLGRSKAFAIKVIRAPRTRKDKGSHRCIYCKLTQPCSEFVHRKTGGITGECHTCARERQLERRVRKDAAEKGLDWLVTKIERDRYVLSKYEALLREMKER